MNCCRWSMKNFASWPAQKMSEERKNHTLQATALVHEAYVRLVNVPNPQEWNSRGHFFAAAAEAIAADSCRAGTKETRPPHPADNSSTLNSVTLSLSLAQMNSTSCRSMRPSTAWLEIDERAAHLVKLRFFAGLTRDEAAQSLGVSVSTVDDDWAYAKGWLRSVLKA